MNLGKAAQKFREKRKKKHLFNDAGVPIEPFGLNEELKEGLISNEGAVILAREKKYEEDDLK